ncbi:MAG: hypothetical protein AAF215_15615 [Cyanobacteria bacterium P01_A01_bin.123]
MSQPHRSAKDRHPLEQYEIRIKGHLDHRWSQWFEGFAIALKDNGETLLSGPVVDQAALYGVLIKVRDLGLPLISVMPTQLEQAKKLDKGEQA